MPQFGLSIAKCFVYVTVIGSLGIHRAQGVISWVKKNHITDILSRLGEEILRFIIREFADLNLLGQDLQYIWFIEYLGEVFCGTSIFS